MHGAACSSQVPWWRGKCTLHHEEVTLFRRLRFSKARLPCILTGSCPCMRPPGSMRKETEDMSKAGSTLSLKEPRAHNWWADLPQVPVHEDLDSRAGLE
jgi:hypothetical protein